MDATKFKELIDTFLFIIRDKQPTKEIVTEDINNILQAVNYNKLREEIDKFEETSDVTEVLAPLLENVIATPTPAPQPTYAYATQVVPSNYEKVTQILLGNTKKVDILTQSELGDVLDSSIIAPTTDYPICHLIGSTFYYYPKTVGQVWFYYIKTPTKPVMVDKLENGIIVMDSASSTPFDWGDSEFDDLLHRMLSYVGISINATELVQYSELKK
jgi:hypothetical protein